MSVATQAHRSVSVTIFDESNFYALLFLAAVGFLAHLRAHSGRVVLFTALIGGMYTVFGYATLLVGLKVAVPDRWLLFGSLVLIFPASIGFVRLFRTSRTGLMLGAVFMGAYFFLGLTNNQANRTNPVYGQSVSYQSAMKSSEYAAMVQVGEVMRQRDTQVRTDSLLWDYLIHLPARHPYWYWYEFDLDKFNGIFVKRPGYSDYRFYGYSDMRAVDTEVQRHRDTISQFYDSGDIQILERRDRKALER